jgi:hypothetical protein
VFSVDTVMIRGPPGIMGPAQHPPVVKQCDGNPQSSSQELVSNQRVMRPGFIFPRLHSPGEARQFTQERARMMTVQNSALRSYPATEAMRSEQSPDPHTPLQAAATQIQCEAVRHTDRSAVEKACESTVVVVVPLQN